MRRLHFSRRLQSESKKSEILEIWKSYDTWQWSQSSLEPSETIPKNFKKRLEELDIRARIVARALGMVPSGLEKRVSEQEIRGRIEAIQTTVLWILGILRSVLETWGDLMSLEPQWRLQLQLLWKHKQLIIIIIMMIIIIN